MKKYFKAGSMNHCSFFFFFFFLEKCFIFYGKKREAKNKTYSEQNSLERVM